MNSNHLLQLALLLAPLWPLVSLELNELPDIKPRLNANLTYRVMYQMQMKSLGFSATVEEWGNLKDSKYRVDLVVDKQRSSYLFLGPSKNNEIFLYKPFVCQQLNLDSHELYVLRDLFAGSIKPLEPSENQSSVQAYGIGPLWMLSKENAIGVNVNVPPPGANKSNPSSSLVTYDLKEWKNRDNTANYTYKLYFRQDRKGFPDMIDWLNKRGGYMLGRAVQVKFEPDPFDPSVFELPIGYGCSRSTKEPVNSPVDLELWPEGEPDRTLIEVITSRLLDDNLNKWESHRSTCHLIHATLNLHNRDHIYYVAEEEYRPSHELERISRMRHVTSSTGGISQLLIYSIDDDTGKCQTRRDDLSNLVKFPFSSDNSQLKTEPQSADSLDLDSIKYLIEDNKEYHLIQRLEEPLARNEVRREAVYERRLPADQKELYNWLGPVSIVKRFKTDTSRGDSWQIIQVFFYSEDLKRVLSKAFIEILDNGKIGLKSLHELTDISACFSDTQKESILVKYPINSLDTATKLVKREPTIFQFLLLNLLGTTSLGLLQLSNLEAEVVNFYVEARMTVLDLPLTLTFDRLERKTIVKTASDSTTLEKVAPNEDACAASCARYNCYQFSYDWFRQRCLLELSKRNPEVGSSDNSNLYVFSPPQGEPNRAWSQLCADPNVPESLHLSSRAIVSCFKQLISYQRVNDKELVPLTISISLDPKNFLSLGEQLKLAPTEVVIESDPLGDFEKLDNLHEPFIQVEYVILFEESGFSGEPMTNGHYFVDVSYERCSEYCADADCRSFAYSEFEQSCHLTNLHKTEDIRKASRNIEGSCIFVLDYLSKFEDLGWALRVEDAAGQMESQDKHDCAVACMEETKFTCQGFYQCPDSTCLMLDAHVSEDKRLLDNLWAGNSSSSLKKEEESQDKCHFFSRSYLSQFGKIYSTKLKTEALPVGPLHEHTAEVGAEGCAKWCIEKGCTAFDVCHQSSGYPAGPTSMCRLSYRVATSELVETCQKCNTFLLSDKSQFNYLNPSSSKDSASLDEEASVKDPTRGGNLFLDLHSEQDLLSAYLATHPEKTGDDNASSRVASHSFHMNLFALFMGLLIGVSLAFAYLQRDTLISLVVRAMDG